MSAAPVPSITDFGELSRLRLSARREDPEALRAAAKQFESLFTQMLLKSARASSLGDDLMGSEQTEFYQDLFDQQIAQQMSAGKGLGIAELLVRQLQHGGATATAPVAAPTRAAAAAAAPAGDFMTRILPHAQKAAAELGVPPQLLAAQAALESGWGQRSIRNADGSASHNLFGIKADAAWKGARASVVTHEYEGGVRRSETAEFRSYASLDEAFADYVSFLKSNPRYATALAQNDAAGFAHGLQRAGYATDPAYARKLLAIAGGERVQLAFAATGTVSA